MRLSAVKDDPGYAPDAMYAEAYLDGIRLQDCITADEECGLALVYAKDPNGKVLSDPVDPDRPLTTVVYGKVEIRWPTGRRV